jgi:hypothetical protein
VPGLPVHLHTTSSIPRNSAREQDAEKALQGKKTVIWFIWFVSFVWLNKTIYEQNKPDEPDSLVSPVARRRIITGPVEK